MAVPDYQTFFLPLLRLTADGKEHTLAQLREQIANELNLTSEDLDEKLSSGQTVYTNRVSWAAVYLTKAGALSRTRRGVFQITERGRDLRGTV